MITDSRSSMRPARELIAATIMAFTIAACATVSPGGTGGTATTSPGDVTRADQGWSTVTREHVDLWLHGFALLTSDTARVPFFQRGYRQRMLDLRRKANAYTALDANQEKLSARFAANPSLVNAQFVAMYFPSLQEIVNATEYVIRAQGDPRASNDPTIQSEIALLAANFPTPADRDWLRLFVQALQDESNRFYHNYWTAEQQARSSARAEVESRWRGTYYPKFRRFLSNTQQGTGELLLSLPLDGEGRTVNDSKRANAIAVAFPETPATAMDAMYVFAHEAVNRVAETAITDNVTPAEQRSGVTGRYSAAGTVRGGAILIQRVAPELADGYMRYYLRSIGSNAPAGDPIAAFTAAFPLPDAIRDAIARQIDTVLGGI
jgi:hypothetical protein